MVYEDIQNAIFKICPEIEGRNSSVRVSGGNFDGLVNYRDTDIWFRDVVMALNKKFQFTILGNYAKDKVEIVIQLPTNTDKVIWEINKPLMYQSSKTMQVLYDWFV